MTKYLRLAAWLALVAIAFMTISPLRERPHLGHAMLERAAAFWAMGCLYGFAYRERWAWSVCVVVMAAGGLELAQLLTPDRHAQFSDAAVKGLAGAIGVLTGAVTAGLVYVARRA